MAAEVTRGTPASCTIAATVDGPTASGRRPTTAGELLLNSAELVQVEAPGRPMNVLFIVETGRFRLYRVVAHGRAVTTAVPGPADGAIGDAGSAVRSWEGDGISSADEGFPRP